MKMKAFSTEERIKSFKHAIRGIYLLIADEHNMRIHIMLAALAVSMGIVFRVDHVDWLVIVVCIGLVWMAEAFNSAIEKMMDHLSPEKHENVKNIKDISAAAVLICTIAVAIVGSIIFIPKICSLLPFC
jgi:diacylglycerol kinase